MAWAQVIDFLWFGLEIACNRKGLVQRLFNLIKHVWRLRWFSRNSIDHVWFGSLYKAHLIFPGNLYSCQIAWINWAHRNSANKFNKTQQEFFEFHKKKFSFKSISKSSSVWIFRHFVQLWDYLQYFKPFIRKSTTWG